MLSFHILSPITIYDKKESMIVWFPCILHAQNYRSERSAFIIILFCKIDGQSFKHYMEIKNGIYLQQGTKIYSGPNPEKF